MLFCRLVIASMQDVVEREMTSHNILKSGGPKRWILAILGIVFFLGAFGWLNLRQNSWLLDQDQIHFVDADCYSRMTRVRILAGMEPFPPPAEPLHFPGFLKNHTFENYPEGTLPHTTAPMDWAILLLWQTLGATESNMDLAGYLISPLLGAALLLAGWVWAIKLQLPWKWSTLLLLGCSPILLHGFAFGRPDHQSLVLLLTGIALMLEAARWRYPSWTLSFLSGLCWGLSFWVSWFEPLVLWIVATLFRAIMLLTRHSPANSKQELLFPLGITAAFAAGTLVLTGFPQTGLSPEMEPYFWRWAQSIGELQSVSLFQFIPRWTGWFGLVLPFVLGWRWWKSRDPLCGFWLILIMVLGTLTLWHMRWGYYLVLGIALAFPMGLMVFSRKWIGVAVFLISLWPMARELERMTFPEGERTGQLVSRRQESSDLSQAGLVLRGMEGNGILAPWWLTPKLVYRSGKDGVAGSSHQSLSGTLAASRFFTGDDPEAARRILRDRKVSFVVVADSGQVLENSLQNLGTSLPGGRTMAALLDRHPSEAPPYLTLVFRNSSCKIYQFNDDEL